MGLVCHNISFRTDNQSEVARIIGASLPEHDAFVAPSHNGWVTVFDADCDEAKEPAVVFGRLAASVCPACECSALALEFDRYCLSYWLFDWKGNLIDRSEPSGDPNTVDDGRGLAGNLDRVVKVLGLSITESAIRSVLEKQEKLLQFNYAALADLLGIANVTRTYQLLFRDCDWIDETTVTGWKDFIHVGSPDPRGW